MPSNRCVRVTGAFLPARGSASEKTARLAGTRIERSDDERLAHLESLDGAPTWPLRRDDLLWWRSSVTRSTRLVETGGEHRSGDEPVQTVTNARRSNGLMAGT